LFASGLAFSQTTNATLGGTVSDPSGALIPGVTISATNNATGITSTVLTNEAGTYQFASLQPGTYKVTAELPGFQTQLANNFTLGLGQQARLNFTLQVGAVSQTVEVSVAADTLLATTSSSVGTVLPESRLNDLPLGSRNVQALLATMAGTGPQGDDGGIYGNFAGGRISSVNVTRDGFVASDGRYTHGEFSQSYTSPDLVEEVKVVTATVDAENTRGSGQVQMVTRAGTNQFKGAVFWTNRNSALDANDWFNNLNGVRPDWENRNQFGFRLGGPIIKNKTFFFFLLDEQRDVIKQNAVGTVLTPLARQGIFRFFPGVDNNNALANVPTVDRLGNPVRPAAATGDVQQFPILGKDPLRPGFDPTGFVQNTLLANMPLPNDYTVGDGLNTAGIRFTRRVYGLDVADGNSNDQNNRDQFNIRIDHNFNSKHNLSGVYTYERSIDHSTQAGLRSYPNGFDGQHSKWPRLYTVSFVSTLSSSMVNEARGGLRRSAIASNAPFYAGRNLDGSGEPTGSGAEAFKLLPRNNGIPFQAVTAFIGTNGFMNWSAGFGSTRSSRSPLWQYADNLSWTRGKHALKFGAESRRDQTTGWNDNNMTPNATFGPGNFPVTGIDNTSVAGLSANNQTAARNMLVDLSGSIGSIREGFDLPNATATQFLGYKDGYVMHDRDWHSNEFSAFFKDDWKFRSSLTLNLGIHWEYFGVPYEGKGRAGQPTAGNETGSCGISCGALTVSRFVGKNSPNSNGQLYNDDWNNFAPSIGLSWSLPWFGKDKTVLRMGYGVAYTGGALKSANTILDSIAGSSPGAAELSGGNGITFTPNAYTNMATIALPIAHQYAPLSPVPIDGQRSDTLSVYSTHRINPYVQNFNFEIQRQVSRTLSVDIAYVGSKSTKLNGGRNLNAVNINSQIAGQTLLDAFNVTRAGNNAPFFDKLLNGINIGGGATTVNGSTVTGSTALRTNTTTRAMLANGNVGALANFLNTSTAGTSKGGGLYTTNGLPQNFIVLNPQFATVNYYDNSASSTYHSLQIQATKRLSHGLANQFTYTWSKALDISDGDGIISPRDPNNFSLEKGRAGFDRSHILTSAGTYELPFGPNRLLLPNATGWIQRIAERWQLGGIFNWSTGSPLTFTAPVSTLWQTTTGATPVALGAVPSDIGKVSYVSNGVIYFPTLGQGRDPSFSTVSSANSLNGSFNNLAILDASGAPLLVNPAPGQAGNVGRNTIVGPGNVRLDMNVIKRVKITESKEFEARVDVVNVLNHANFGNPTVNINSTNFGRITSASGARRFTFNARINF